MLSLFESFKSQNEILKTPFSHKLCGDFKAQNLLIHSDNLNAMRYLLQVKNYKNKIDLVYIDPPFGTNNNFYLGSTMSARVDSKLAYKDKFSLESYLEFLYERLILIREMMSERGSIYLHIDSKMGHYVKILMDSIFGRENFINDITRIKCNPKNFDKKGYGNIKDVILFYAKTSHFIWNEIKQENTQEDLKRFSKKDENGFYTTIPLHAPGNTKNGQSGAEWMGLKPPDGRHWRCSLGELDELERQGLIHWSKNKNPRKKVYFDENKGKKIQDIWEFKDPQKVLYPTQKNPKMLRQIIEMSSNQDSIVMDCFCGSGAFLEQAIVSNRRFIGIDESVESIKINQQWLEKYNKNLYRCDCGMIKNEGMYKIIFD